MRTSPDFPELWPHPGPQQYQTIAFALAGLAAVAAAWILANNTNLFYVVFLSCSYIALQLLVWNPTLRLGLFAFFLFFLFYSPKETAAVTEQKKYAYEPWQSSARILPAGATRTYRFMLAPLHNRQSECSSLQRADIFVHGKNAGSEDPVPLLTIDHGTISRQTRSPLYGAFVELRGRAEFADGLPAEVRVGLRNPAQNPFEIYLGPEVVRTRAYPEAVFMKFDTPECHIVVHGNPID